MRGTFPAGGEQAPAPVPSAALGPPKRPPGATVTPPRWLRRRRSPETAASVLLLRLLLPEVAGKEGGGAGGAAGRSRGCGDSCVLQWRKMEPRGFHLSRQEGAWKIDASTPLAPAITQNVPSCPHCSCRSPPSVVELCRLTTTRLYLRVSAAWSRSKSQSGVTEQVGVVSLGVFGGS